MAKKKLKVLYLVDNFYPVTGGINTVVDSSCRELIKKIDVAVCAVKHKTYKDPERPYPVYRCPGYYNFVTNDGMAHPTKEFEKFIENEHFDILHCHTAGNLLDFALKLGKKNNIPVLITIHNTYYAEVKSFVKFGFLAKLITKIFFKRTDRADYIWSVTKYCEQNARRFGLKNPVKVMQNSTNLEVISTKDLNNNKEIINKKHNIKSNDFVVSFISRIIKAKNTDLVLETAKLLKEKYSDIKDIKFMFVGDGSYLKKAKQFVKKNNLEDMFVFTGMITDRNLVSKYYLRSDLILFPSMIESAGLIHIEASAYNKPSLVIKNTAPSENIVNGKNGLVSENNAESYLKQILFAYKNRETLEEMGKEANKTLFTSYKDEKVINEIIGEYEKIIKDYKNNKTKAPD